MQRGKARLLSGVRYIDSPLLDRFTAGAIAATIVAAVVFVAEALRRRDALAPFALDEALLQQVIWNTAHGRWFQSSFVDYNFLGEHFQPALLVFAAAQRLGAGPSTPVIAQAIAVAAAGGLLFGAARAITGSRSFALAATVAWLSSPLLHRWLESDFHPDVMTAPFVFASIWAAASRRPWLAVAIALPLLSLKEDEPLVLLSLAGFMWFRFDTRRPALALALIAAAWLTVVVGVVMPELREGVEQPLYQRYGYIDRDVTAPFDALGHLLHREQLEAAALLIGSTGLIALLDPFAVVLASPVALGNMLSTHPEQEALRLHYSAEALPLMFVAALFGARRLRTLRWRRLRVPAAVPLLCGAAVTFAAVSPLRPWRDEWSPPDRHISVVKEALALIADDASVSASTHIAPRLAHRERLYEFPLNPPDAPADWVIVDTGMGTTQQALDAGFRQRLDALEQQGYRRRLAEDGLFVFERVR